MVDSVYNFENPELLTWDESIGVNQDLCFGCFCVLMNNFFHNRTALFRAAGRDVPGSFCVCCVILCNVLCS